MEDANAYSEIYSYIKILGKKYINKLSKDEYIKIYENRNKKYNPEFILSDFNNEKKISYEAKIMILYYHLKYWCENDEERNNIKKIIINTEMNNKKY